MNPIHLYYFFIKTRNNLVVINYLLTVKKVKNPLRPDQSLVDEEEYVSKILGYVDTGQTASFLTLPHSKQVSILAGWTKDIQVGNSVLYYSTSLTHSTLVMLTFDRRILGSSSLICETSVSTPASDV